MIKLIIFDFDGVIVESVDIKTRAFAKLFEKEDKENIQKIVGYHLKNTGVSRYEKFRHIYKDILNRALNNEEFESLCSRFSSIVKDEVIRAPFVKGADSFLKEYVSKYRFFILSATPQEEIEEILRAINISQFFVGVYGSPTEKTTAVKDILAKEKSGIDNVLYIGDSLSDYIAAKNNSIKFVARISNNESIFSKIDCSKINDLEGFKDKINEF